jgi:hypothetical protein
MNFNEQKKEFRKSKAWREFSKELKAERKVDALTLTKLRKGSLSHHLDLNPDHYEDLNKEHFECLNMKSHDVVHFMYNYYKKDPAVIDRLKDILHKMILLNGDW